MRGRRDAARRLSFFPNPGAEAPGYPRLPLTRQLGGRRNRVHALRLSAALRFHPNQTGPSRAPARTRRGLGLFPVVSLRCTTGYQLASRGEAPNLPLPHASPRFRRRMDPVSHAYQPRVCFSRIWRPIPTSISRSVRRRLRFPKIARWISSEEKRPALRPTIFSPSFSHRKIVPGPAPSNRRISTGTEICP